MKRVFIVDDRKMKKLLVIVMLVSIIVVLNACIDVNRVSEANLYQNGEIVFNYTKEEHADEIKILVTSVNKVKNQKVKVDMPPSDYQLEFVLKDGENLMYSLWIEPESSFILKNSTSSYFIQLSPSDTDKLNQVVTEFDASGIKYFNFYYLVMAIPVLIVIPMLIDIVGRKRGSR